MAADHHKNDRQGHIVVVYRTLFSQHTIGRVWLLAILSRIHQIMLAGNNPHPDIKDHNDAHQCTNMDVGSATRKNLREPIGNNAKSKKTNSRRHFRVFVAPFRHIHAVVE